QLVPFTALSEDYLRRVLEHAEVMTIARGKFIFRRGKPSTSRYYLLDGQVELVATDWTAETIDAGSERACLPLCDTSPTTVSAMVKADARLLRVDADFLDIAMAWN